jgi:formylglycine-generating enzyme required for sulfatase activity
MGAPWCEWGRAKRSTDPVQVTLTHAFEIAQFELTQREWTALVAENPSGLMADGTGDCLEPDCPLGNVTWFEALEFTNRKSRSENLPPCYELSECTGEFAGGMLCDHVKFVGPSVYDCKGYRLPTGAEWEYAARAGTKTSVYSGDIVPIGGTGCYEDPVLAPIAWYCFNAGPYTHPVGKKIPNAWGLYDMLGNAGELVGSLGTWEGYGEGPYVDHGASLDAKGFLDPALPVLAQWRGGTWNVPAPTVRAALQIPLLPSRGPGGGLRLARTVTTERTRAPIRTPAATGKKE